MPPLLVPKVASLPWEPNPRADVTQIKLLEDVDGLGNPGTNWKEEFAKCTRHLEDAATLMDAINPPTKVSCTFYLAECFTSICRAGRNQSKVLLSLHLRKTSESYLEATRRLLTIVQRKEQLIWEFKSKPGDPSPRLVSQRKQKLPFLTGGVELANTGLRPEFLLGANATLHNARPLDRPRL